MYGGLDRWIDLMDELVSLHVLDDCIRWIDRYLDIQTRPDPHTHTHTHVRDGTQVGSPSNHYCSHRLSNPTIFLIRSRSRSLLLLVFSFLPLSIVPLFSFPPSLFPLSLLPLPSLFPLHLGVPRFSPESRNLPFIYRYYPVP